MSDASCRVAVLSVHTSPLELPGSGDAGGMNVYIREVAEEMSRRGVRSDIFTRRTSADEPWVVEASEGVRVFSVRAGPERPVHKERLPTLSRRFAESIVDIGPYDVVHAHYWISGVSGAYLSRAWNVPLVMSFHTLARVKDAASPGDPPEPIFRKRGEDRVIEAADRIIAPTETERGQLVDLYDADPSVVSVVPPGVDLDRFAPGDAATAKQRFGFGGEPTIVFVGRLQPFKGTDVAIHALAHLRRMVPDARLVIVGGDSPRGSRGERMRLRLAARRIGVADRLRFLEPVPHDVLPDLYRAADVVVVPSASESFGLVALEAAACGTPVVATAVGGLRLTVRDGETGYLVGSRDPAAFAAALSRVLADPSARDRLGANAVRLASAYPWARTADGILETYASVTACPDVRRALAGVV
ncbi:MAG TPA: glycosyltransferase [Actinomycetota bacterium]|jgi:D-inositol-3-phosphate glycosyltransferase|nr:glycosyltransferase [Actinomycetota bacterium]